MVHEWTTTRPHQPTTTSKGQNKIDLGHKQVKHVGVFWFGTDARTEYESSFFFILDQSEEVALFFNYGNNIFLLQQISPINQPQQ